MNPEQLKEARALFEETEHDGRDDLLVFIESSGEITPIKDKEWVAGERGHVSVSPQVYLIYIEEVEDEEEEYYIQLLQTDSLQDLDEHIFGAFVLMPTADGSEHVEQPRLYKSTADLEELMLKWGLV